MNKYSTRYDTRQKNNPKKIALAFALLVWSFALFGSSPVLAAGDVTVTLQIPIIGEKKITVCASTSGPRGKQIFKCEGIAKYISAIYQWLVASAAILAVLAFSYAGVLWLIAGGNSGKITESKKIMGNALVGLLLALGSYMFLNEINPNLVRFKPIRVPGIASVSVDLDPKEILIRTKPPTGTCCPTAEASEIINLIKKNGVNDTGGKSGGFEKNYSRMKPKLFAAIKMVLEQCPDAGLVITSTLRTSDGGSWHQKGGAIDFSGKICGVEPVKLCDSAKTTSLITSLMSAGYEVGTWTGVCSNFKDRGTGPHMHIELPGSPY